MSTSFKFTLIRRVLRSATVNKTVPALNEDTPEVTVSPSSTPFVMTTPDIGLVTRARWVKASPEIALRDVVLQRLAADEAVLEEPLLRAELALGVLQADVGLRDAGPHVGER